MKAKALFVLLSLSLLVFPAGSLRAQKAEQPTATAGKAAMVNGVVIPEEEVNRFLLYQQQRLLATTGQVIRPEMMTEARKQVLENLIERELLYQQSRKQGISVKDAEVNEQLDQVKKQYPSEQAFKDSMAEDHLTEDTVKSRIRMNLAVQQFVEREFAGKADVTEAEAKSFYDEHPEYFAKPEKAIPFKEAEESIRQHLASLKLKQKVEEYLKEVKKTAKIERMSTGEAN